MVLSETEYSSDEVDRISDLFNQADELFGKFKEATKDLTKEAESSDMMRLDGTEDYLDDFDQIIKHEETETQKPINLDEV